MDRLESMSVFIKAADAGSFAAAGKALDLSPQMIGKHVQFLEDRLGTRLLNRTTRRQSLTEFGLAYYERCKLVLAEVEVADALAKDTRRTPSGRLRINAPVTFGTYCLMPLVTRYLRENPLVQVDLTLSDRLVDVVDDGYEAVIRLGPLEDSSLVGRALAPYRLMVCAAPSYLSEHGTPHVPADLARHECLGFALWRKSLARTWRFTRDGQSEAVDVACRLRANDWKALLAAALDGYGVLLGPEVALEEPIRDGRLVRLLPDYAAPSRPMHIVFAADRHPTPKLRGFIDLVVAAYGVK